MAPLTFLEQMNWGLPPIISIAIAINASADMSNQTITIRTESDTVKKISAIAGAMDRYRNWVIEDALKPLTLTKVDPVMLKIIDPPNAQLFFRIG